MVPSEPRLPLFTVNLSRPGLEVCHDLSNCPHPFCLLDLRSSLVCSSISWHMSEVPGNLLMSPGEALASCVLFCAGLSSSGGLAFPPMSYVSFPTLNPSQGLRCLRTSRLSDGAVVKLALGACTPSNSGGLPQLQYLGSSIQHCRVWPSIGASQMWNLPRILASHVLLEGKALSFSRNLSLRFRTHRVWVFRLFSLLAKWNFLF